ncbi:kinesin-like protein [Plasmopara halstedii]|uniref:Kinesin-like protein n=1 Tax=Plasmopara halstedii TaxID=4781 RepID=A0A0P1AKI0_PLAHL|nr:kinesin-like protein [Plasmopara halstedii]CEG41628.1 kinesin-like protein [Plasmopara halstedii]|eukprot:XP_024577997.1 kinesin-like protein [Plasmopara halstedii]
MDSSYMADSDRVVNHLANMAALSGKEKNWSICSSGTQRPFDSLTTSASHASAVPRPSERFVKVFDEFLTDNQTECSDRSSELSSESVEPRPEKTAEEDTYSPVIASVEFLMSRVPEDEEKELDVKSDRDKAHFYKKRYTDTYEHAVALLKHAASLERERNEKQTDLEYLRSTIGTQTQIINTLGDSKHLNEPADFQQEKRIQALCREVTGLVMQLNERDTLIHSLHEERDRSAKVSNEFKMSQGLTSSDVSENVRSNCKLTRVELELEAARFEKREALERESKASFQLNEMKKLYEKCEAARSALSDGLDRAQEQTTALHAQWVREKKEILSSAKNECERLREEIETLKNSLFQVSEDEKKALLTIEFQQQAASKSQTQVARLESELEISRRQLSVLRDKKARIWTVENELSEERKKLRRCLLHVGELDEKLKEKEVELQAANALFRMRADLLERRVNDAEAVRRTLHNKVMELKGNIRVFCRVRPVLLHEVASAREEEIFAFPDYCRERRQIELSANPKSHIGYGQNGSRSVVKKYNFDFDLVFGSSCTQEDVFLEVSALIQSALDGFKVCIFAYGQTGSGKTFTMQGKEDMHDIQIVEVSPDMGIVGRAISYIFAGMNDLRTSGWEFTASLQSVEIYNETLRDLLAPIESTDKIDLRLDSEGNFDVVNSFIQRVKNAQEAWNSIQGAMSRRSTKFTKMNDRSSRSHCVITIRLNGVSHLTGKERTGVINLVDLAGSERLPKSGSDSSKELMKEATSINKSLSALGNVICALAKKSTHVPFRDSKLTHFLSASLGGDSKTLMICNLSPLGKHRDETLNSLRFAKMVNSCEIVFPSTISNRS